MRHFSENLKKQGYSVIYSKINNSSNTFTVNRNGNTINGAASNLAKTTDGESFGLMYNGSTWRTY